MLEKSIPFQYMFMRPPQIQTLIQRCPIVLQPSGLLEWHGDQNPIGLDGLVSSYICERAIQGLGDGALMPINWIGTYGYIRYPGTICYDKDTAIKVFQQLYQEQIKIGFRIIMIVLGHWGQWNESALKIARERVEKYAKKKGVKVVLFGVRWADFLMGNTMGGHGQEGETAVIWRMAEENHLNLVNLNHFQLCEENIPKYPINEKGVPVREPPIWKWEKNLKDPSICSPIFGEELVKMASEGIVEEIKTAMQELGIEFPKKHSQESLQNR